MKILRYLLPVIFIFTLFSCSINRFATKIVADALIGSGEGSVFTSDDDPELIADALPFTLKVFESLLQSGPENLDLIEACAGGFVSYANGFLQSPAELLEYEQIKKKDHLFHRAAAMYRRGGRYASRGLELLYPGFEESFKKGEWQTVFENLEIDAVPFLYWKAAAILGEFSVDSFNPELMLSIPGAVALTVRAMELNEDYDRGVLHDLFIAVFGNLSASLVYRSKDRESSYSILGALEVYYADYGLIFSEMSAEDQVMFHLNRAVKLSAGMKASPYVSASSIYITNQDYDGLKAILQEAIHIDPDLNPEYRLMNIISQRKAEWLMDHIEDYIFIP